MHHPEYNDYSPWLERIDHRAANLEDTLTRLAAINSGSFNVTGLRRMGEAMVALFAPLGGVTERCPLAPFEALDDEGQVVRRPLAEAVRIRKRPDAPLQVLLVGHLDTVFGPDHPFQHVRRLADNHINGPGVADLKGGLLVMLQALQALERSPWAATVGWEVLLNPDEEIGSPGSAPLLAEAAARHHLGLVFEPAMPDGALAGARKGSGNFTVVAEGRAAHAGREHHRGRNAVRALADCVAAVDDLNGGRDGITVNPAFVHGGGALNVVPDRALLRFNVRVGQPGDETWFSNRLAGILDRINARDGLRLTLHGGFGRKPRPLTQAHTDLLQMIAACGRDLDTPVTWRDTGGCCDGNNLAAAGLPNVDTLGVVGGGIHSADEYMDPDSLTTRARLSALLLMRLAAGEYHFPRAGGAGTAP